MITPSVRKISKITPKEKETQQNRRQKSVSSTMVRKKQRGSVEENQVKQATQEMERMS